MRAACRAKLYQLSSLNEEDELVVHMQRSKRVESVFSAHYTCTCKLDTAVSFVAINSFPCRLLGVKKKIFVESGQIVLANSN